MAHFSPNLIVKQMKSYVIGSKRTNVNNTRNTSSLREGWRNIPH